MSINETQPCSFCKESTTIMYSAGDGYEKAEPLCEKCMMEVYNKLAPIRKKVAEQEKNSYRPDYQKLGRYDKQKKEANS